MFKFIETWKRNRRRKRARKGLEWAAAELLLGTETPETLTRYVDESRDFDTRDDFDVGVESAVDLWEVNHVQD